MNLYKNTVKKLNELIMWICGILILFMGFLITADVILRSTMKYSIQWAFAMDGYICATVALLAGGYGLLARQHVKVDIFYAKFTPRLKGIIDILTSSLLFLLCGVFVWIGFNTCLESLAAGYTTQGVINIPLFIPQLLIPLGGLFLGLQAIVDLINNIKLALGNTVDEED
ncbi:TRAP-type mannitol/chloroaromatic compound transport system, small permease component [Desulfotomaculum arcticum]|uniref:TRAP-type mannitol/chloroaromatic compound transport system, small permease component n=1 Tax=Desulfotruncus arcticus DSM 17038 TaxID=1121424 RepID=A0A1I2XST5_9FIRM|nr:TRAP transporter small permease subunit [Desulfotruncus arcticus]SFH15786.1 TRAP-type mannitol/chloroaromatic compound transport system, small permease component [Desulfotomaculum arcticum] [Desulfotruncus arcticus DSM 17038]